MYPRTISNNQMVTVQSDHDFEISPEFLRHLPFHLLAYEPDLYRRRTGEWLSEKLL